MRATILLVLAGCAGDPATAFTTTTELAPEPDPDVQSYVPPGFPAASAARVVFFGDSITHGYGIDNAENTYPALLELNNDRKWPTMAGEDLSDRFSGLEVVDVSRDGATTSTVISGQLPMVESLLGEVVSGPTLVVGTVGGNDLLDVLFAEDIEAGLAAVLANIETITGFFLDQTRFPDGAYLALTNVYDPTDGAGQADECFFGISLSSFSDDFDALADDSLALAERDGWAWVDLRGHFRGHGFNYDKEGSWTDAADPSLWFQDDCIHPNVRGHHEIRRLFLAALDGTPLPLVPPPESGANEDQ